MNRIHFMPRHKAVAIAPPPNCAIVSIKTPFDDEASLAAGWRAILRLSYFDTDDAKDSSIVPGTVFDAEKAGQVLDFVEANIDCEELVVHCDLGVSRSAAVALVLGEVLAVPVFRWGTPVDPQYRLHNAYVYRTLHSAWLARLLTARGG